MVAGSCRGLALSNVLVMASGPARVPRCLPPQQPLGVVAAPAPAAWGVLPCRWLGGTQGRFATVWRGPQAGSRGWHSCHHWQWAGRAGAVLCVYIHLLGTAGAWHAPQPTVALEGEAPTSLMHSVPPLEIRPPTPTQGVGRWQGGASKVTFCFISVMTRLLTTCAGLVGVQGHLPRQLPELWPSCPCRQLSPRVCLVGWSR